MTIFLSTHILPAVDELADTIGVINDGSVVAEAPPQELKARTNESPDLETAFLEITSERERTNTGTNPTSSDTDGLRGTTTNA